MQVILLILSVLSRASFYEGAESLKFNVFNVDFSIVIVEGLMCVIACMNVALVTRTSALYIPC